MSICPLDTNDKACVNPEVVCAHPRSYHTSEGCLAPGCPCGQYIEPVTGPEFVQDAMQPSRGYHGSQANGAERFIHNPVLDAAMKRKSFLEGTWYHVEEQHVCVFDSAVHLIPIYRSNILLHYANMLACACGKYKPYPIAKD